MIRRTQLITDFIKAWRSLELVDGSGAASSEDQELLRKAVITVCNVGSLQVCCFTSQVVMALGVV